MGRYFAKRLMHSTLIVWGVVTIIFIIIHLAPGDPTQIYISPEISPATVDKIKNQFGLNRPLHLQYYHWLKSFLSGEFGFSLYYQKNVSSLLWDTLPNTAILGSLVLILHFPLAVLLGLVTAIRRQDSLGRFFNNLFVVLYSIPGFWVALMLVWIFSYQLGWLPSSQMHSISAGSGFLNLVLDRIKHAILPVTVLLLPFISLTARMLSEKLAEILNSEFYLTAKSLGIRPRKLLLSYALRNSLYPLATLAGLYLPFLFGGAVITEYIFSWPGMGRLAITAIFTRDYPVILACTVVASVMVVLGNLLSDLLYALIDPRVEVDEV
ncbi:MAG: ABC transporter permease [Calditrichia bacterium]